MFTESEVNLHIVRGLAPSIVTS